ncbi:hypothetical protein MVEN_02501600 [Mycena venus]|uniref:Uncharacterized protein n=1 Tax=Mycena venus TaxID=2733690 RepID=A0A8H6U061_9AGAR|nr:hypothetical protein MVEN_02501600 [Mycena venus]
MAATLKSSPSPRVPHELCEEILACVPVKYERAQPVDSQDPYFTLRQCALVCRAWLPSARSHIFHTVHLSYRTGDRLRKLLDLNPTLSRYMIKVIVRRGMVFDPCPLKLVAELAQKLTAVKDLTVYAGISDDDSMYFDVSERIQQLQSAILPMVQAPTLVTMTLEDFFLCSKEFICIPSLVTLIFKNVRLDPELDWTSDTGLDRGGSVQPIARRLSISGLGLYSQNAALERWLLHRSCPLDVTTLREFHIGLKDVGNIREFLPMLNAIGDSLKVFGLRFPARCDFREYSRFSGIMDAIPTFSNIHIEHIIISGFDRRDPSVGVYNRHFDGAELVKSLLLRLSAPKSLKTVTIYEDVEIIWQIDKEFPNLQWQNWRGVDEVLAQDSFSNVKRLDFVAGLKSLELQCDAGTVFSLTVDYTSLAWHRAQAALEDMDYPLNSGDV